MKRSTLSWSGLVPLFVVLACTWLHAAERPPQAPLPPQAPAIQAAPARTTCAACNCAETGVCACGPECNCSLKVINDIFKQAAKDDLDPRYKQFAKETGGKSAKASHHQGYSVRYFEALKTGKPLIVWVACGSATCEEDCPQFLHAYERKFLDVVGPAVVIAKVEGGKLIHVETVAGIPSCDEVTGALALHERRKLMARSQAFQPAFFGGFRGGCSGGSCR